MAALVAVKQTPEAASPAQKSAPNAGRAFRATLQAMQVPVAVATPASPAVKPQLLTGTDTQPKRALSAGRTQAKSGQPSTHTQSLPATLPVLPIPDATPHAALPTPATSATAAASHAAAASPSKDTFPAPYAPPAEDTDIQPNPTAAGQKAQPVPTQSPSAQAQVAGADIQAAAAKLPTQPNATPALTPGRPGSGQRQIRTGGIQVAPPARQALTALPALAALLPDEQTGATDAHTPVQVQPATHGQAAAPTPPAGQASTPATGQPGKPPAQPHGRNAEITPHPAAMQVAAQADADSTPPVAQDHAAGIPATLTSPPAAAVQAAPAQATPVLPAPSSAASQLAPVLTTVHVPQGSTKDITIQLQPETLGGVQVRITRGVDGAASVTLQADRADTLHTLQQDAAHLHQALDRAGLPAERSLTFQLGHTGTQATAGTPSGGTSGSGGFAGQSGHAGGGANRQHSQTGQQAPRSPSEQATASTGQPAPAARLDGLNITA